MKERTVSIEELEKGMLIAADVHTDGGVVVVPQNTVVSTEVLNLLARHSIMEVSVKENNDGFPPRKAIKETAKITTAQTAAAISE